MVWNHDIEGVTALKFINLISTLISLSGTLWASYYCIKVPSAINNSLKFIFAITFADLVFSCCNLMAHFEAEEELSTFCYVEAFIRQCSFFLSLFFATSLSLLCFKAAKYGDLFDQDSFFKKVLAIGLAICLLMTSL